MVDQLEFLRTFRADVPFPSALARVSARSALNRAILAEPRRQRTPVNNPGRLVLFPGTVRTDSHQNGWSRGLLAHVARSQKYRNLGTMKLAAAALVVIVVAAALHLAGGQPGGIHSPVNYMQASVLTAFDSTAGDVLYVQQRTTTSDGKSGSVDIWTYPAQKPQTGQRVEQRTLILSAVGAPVQDVAVKFLVGGTLAAIPSKPGRYVAGEIIDVEYATRSWSDQLNQPIVGPNYASDNELREQIASGNWTKHGTTTLSGERVIELWLNEPAGQNILWLSAKTYLPVKSIFKYLVGPSTSSTYTSVETDYAYLPPTPANVANLQPSIPSDFTKTTAPPNLYPQG